MVRDNHGGEAGDSEWLLALRDDPLFLEPNWRSRSSKHNSSTTSEDEWARVTAAGMVADAALELVGTAREKDSSGGGDNGSDNDLEDWNATSGKQTADDDAENIDHIALFRWRLSHELHLSLRSMTNRVPFEVELFRRISCIQKAYEAYARERERTESAAKASALSSHERLRAVVKDLPPVASALGLFSRLLMVATSGPVDSPTSETLLQTITGLLTELKPLSLRHESVVCLDSLEDWLTRIAAPDSGVSGETRRTAITVMLGLALARGSLSSALGVVKLLLHKCDGEEHIGLLDVSTHLKLLEKHRPHHDLGAPRKSSLLGSAPVNVPFLRTGRPSITSDGCYIYMFDGTSNLVKVGTGCSNTIPGLLNQSAQLATPDPPSSDDRIAYAAGRIYRIFSRPSRRDVLGQIYNSDDLSLEKDILSADFPWLLETNAPNNGDSDRKVYSLSLTSDGHLLYLVRCSMILSGSGFVEGAKRSFDVLVLNPDLSLRKCIPLQCSTKETTLSLEVKSNDGGQYSSSYGAAMMLQNNMFVFCSKKPRNVNVGLAHPEGKEMVVKSFTVRRPTEGFSCPVGSGIVMVASKAAPDSILEKYDNLTVEQFDQMREKGIDEEDGLQLVGHFKLDNSNPVAIRRLDRPVRARYVYVKFLKACDSSDGNGNNIDVQYFGVHGHLVGSTDYSTPLPNDAMDVATFYTNGCYLAALCPPSSSVVSQGECGYSLRYFDLEDGFVETDSCVGVDPAIMSDVDLKDMRQELSRLLTFADGKWPHRDTHVATPYRLAQAGFFKKTSHVDDMCTCFSCNVALALWEPQDEPWSEHRHHSSSCSFVVNQGCDTKNVVSPYMGVCYDHANNLIWTVRHDTLVLGYWKNSGPPPPAPSNGTTGLRSLSIVDDEGSSEDRRPRASLIQGEMAPLDVVDKLLTSLAHLSSVHAVVEMSGMKTNAAVGKNSTLDLQEPFCVEVTPSGFRLLGGVMETYAQMFFKLSPDDFQTPWGEKVVSGMMSVLKLLMVNISRLVSLRVSFEDICAFVDGASASVEEAQSPLKSILQILFQLGSSRENASNRREAEDGVRSAALDVLIVGLDVFYPTNNDKTSLLLQLLSKHKSSSVGHGDSSFSSSFVGRALLKISHHEKIVPILAPAVPSFIGMDEKVDDRVLTLLVNLACKGSHSNDITLALLKSFQSDLIYNLQQARSNTSTTASAESAPANGAGSSEAAGASDAEKPDGAEASGVEGGVPSSSASSSPPPNATPQKTLGSRHDSPGFSSTVLVKYLSLLVDESVSFLTGMAKEEDIRKVEDLYKKTPLCSLLPPLLAALCSIQLDLKTAARVITVFPSFLSALDKINRRDTRLADIENNFKKVAGSVRQSEEHVVESSHPYKSKGEPEEVVSIPGASQLLISFDKRCSTESDYDYLEIYQLQGKRELIGRYTGEAADGKQGRWPSAPVVVKGDCALFNFHVESQRSGWGFRCTVVGRMEVTQAVLPTLYDMQKMVAWLGGRLAANLIEGPSVSDEGGDNRAVLESGLIGEQRMYNVNALIKATKPRSLSVEAAPSLRECLGDVLCTFEKPIVQLVSSKVSSIGMRRHSSTDVRQSLVLDTWSLASDRREPHRRATSSTVSMDTDYISLGGYGKDWPGPKGEIDDGDVYKSFAWDIAELNADTPAHNMHLHIKSHLRVPQFPMGKEVDYAEAGFIAASLSTSRLIGAAYAFAKALEKENASSKDTDKEEKDEKERRSSDSGDKLEIPQQILGIYRKAQTLKRWLIAQKQEMSQREDDDMKSGVPTSSAKMDFSSLCLRVAEKARFLVEISPGDDGTMNTPEMRSSIPPLLSSRSVPTMFSSGGTPRSRSEGAANRSFDDFNINAGGLESVKPSNAQMSMSQGSSKGDEKFNKQQRRHSWLWWSNRSERIRSKASRDQGDDASLMQFMQSSMTLNDTLELLRRRWQRAATRSFGFLTMHELLEAASLDSVQSDILCWLPVAIRKTGRQTAASKERHIPHYLDDLNNIGPLCSMLVSNSFYRLYSKLSDLLHAPSSDPSLVYFGLHSWCMEFKPIDHTFLIRAQVIDKFLDLLVRVSLQAGRPASPDEDLGGNGKQWDSKLRQSCWNILRLVASVCVKNHSEVSADDDLAIELIDKIFRVIQKLQKGVPNDNSLLAKIAKDNTIPKFAMTEEEDVVTSQLLGFLHMLADNRHRRRLLADSKHVWTLLSLVLVGSLRVQRLSSRLLKCVLPLLTPDTLKNSGFSEESGKTNESFDILDLFVKTIGNTVFEHSSKTYCSNSEIIMLLRVLLGSVNWSQDTEEQMTAYLKYLPDALKQRDHYRIALSLGALVVVGGHLMRLRTGARVFVDSRDDISGSIGTIVWYDQTCSRLKVLLGTKVITTDVRHVTVLPDVKLSKSMTSRFFPVIHRVCAELLTSDLPEGPDMKHPWIYQFCRMLSVKAVHVILTSCEDDEAAATEMERLMPLLVEEGLKLCPLDLRPDELEMKEVACREMYRSIMTGAELHQKLKVQASNSFFQIYRDRCVDLPQGMLPWNDAESATTAAKVGLPAGPEGARAIYRSNVALHVKLPFYYFEISILTPGKIFIGVTYEAESSELGPTSYSYHGDDGQRHVGENALCEYGCTFGKDDVVGCAWSSSSGCLYFTVNGQKLGTAFQCLKGPLYLIAGVEGKGAHVRLNFGKDLFCYDCTADANRENVASMPMEIATPPRTTAGMTSPLAKPEALSGSSSPKGLNLQIPAIGSPSAMSMALKSETGKDVAICEHALQVNGGDYNKALAWMQSMDFAEFMELENAIREVPKWGGAPMNLLQMQQYQHDCSADTRPRVTRVDHTNEPVTPAEANQFGPKLVLSDSADRNAEKVRIDGVRIGAVLLIVKSITNAVESGPWIDYTDHYGIVQGVDSDAKMVLMMLNNEETGVSSSIWVPVTSVASPAIAPDYIRFEVESDDPVAIYRAAMTIEKSLATIYARRAISCMMRRWPQLTGKHFVYNGEGTEQLIRLLRLVSCSTDLSLSSLPADVRSGRGGRIYSSDASVLDLKNGLVHLLRMKDGNLLLSALVKEAVGHIVKSRHVPHDTVAVYESNHPFVPMERSEHICIEGARSLVVTFHSKCNVSSHDFLTFYPDCTFSKRIKRMNGTQFSSMAVPMNRVWYRFTNHSSNDNSHHWGYRFYVSPRFIELSECNALLQPNINLGCWILELMTGTAVDSSRKRTKGGRPPLAGVVGLAGALAGTSFETKDTHDQPVIMLSMEEIRVVFRSLLGYVRCQLAARREQAIRLMIQLLYYVNGLREGAHKTKDNPEGAASASASGASASAAEPASTSSEQTAATPNDTNEDTQQYMAQLVPPAETQFLIDELYSRRKLEGHAGPYSSIFTSLLELVIMLAIDDSFDDPSSFPPLDRHSASQSSTASSVPPASPRPVQFRSNESNDESLDMMWRLVLVDVVQMMKAIREPALWARQDALLLKTLNTCIALERPQVLRYSTMATQARRPGLTVSQVIQQGTDFTVALWVYLREEPTGVWRTIFLKGKDAAQARTPAAFFNPDNKRVVFCVSTTENWNDALRGVQEVGLGCWTHLAFVREGRKMSIYVNGEHDDSRLTDGDTVMNHYPFYLGKTPPNVKRPESDYDSFDGYMEKAIYCACALSPGTILALSRETPPPPKDISALDAGAAVESLVDLHSSKDLSIISRSYGNMSMIDAIRKSVPGFVTEDDPEQGSTIRVSDSGVEWAMETMRSWKPEYDVALMNVISKLCDLTSRNVYQLGAEELAKAAEQNSMLADVPRQNLLLWFSVLKLWNINMQGLLPYFDYSQRDRPWSLAYHLCSLRHLIFRELKTNFLERGLRRTDTNARRPRLRLNRHSAAKANSDSDGRKTLFWQAFRQLQNVDSSQLRQRDRAWEVTFEGEGAEDYGGPYRESLSHLCSDLRSDTLPLFTKCPNGLCEVGDGRDKLLPNPASCSRTQLAMFAFLGKMMGIAIRTRSTLNLDLPSIVWKGLVGEKVEMEDLAAVDLLCCRFLDDIINAATPDDFEPIRPENFTAYNGNGTRVELKKRGAAIPVDWDNRLEYAEVLLSYRLHEYDKQIAAMRTGLFKIVPECLLASFTWRELELTICGKPEVDLHLLKQRVHYRQYSPTDRVIQDFWRVMESLTQEQRRQFLRFVCGASRLTSLESDIEIQRYDRPDPDRYLPVAQTCFFSMRLPAYSNEEVMRERLIYAISEGLAIDMDYNVRQSEDVWETDDENNVWSD